MLMAYQDSHVRADCKQCCRIQQAMGEPSKEHIHLKLQKHPSLTAGSAIPLVTGTMVVSSVVGTSNTASGTTSRTGPSTTCEVGQGNLGGQHRQSASAIEVEDLIAEVPVAELQRTDPGPVSTIYKCVQEGVVLTEVELQGSCPEQCRLHSDLIDELL